MAYSRNVVVMNNAAPLMIPVMMSARQNVQNTVRTNAKKNRTINVPNPVMRCAMNLVRKPAKSLVMKNAKRQKGKRSVLNPCLKTAAKWAVA